ncbi:MAG: hypothetical protein WHX93_17210 [bacterium]
MSRKVCVQRTLGEKHPHFSIGAAWEGWELTPPRVGEIYVLFTEKGSVFRTSKVIQVGPGNFKTKNSLYTISVLQEDNDSSGHTTQELTSAQYKSWSPSEGVPRQEQ